MSTDDLSPGPHAASESDVMAARLATIVANSDDVIISKTLAGIITSWNGGATRIFGYEPEEIIGQHISKIIPPELLHEEKDIIARLSRGERIEHFETVRVAKDGRQVHISLTVSPMRDSTGRIIGASKVARDISDRRRAEETQRLLIDELNHRIKNTLATVQAIATQTLRRAATPADFVESFNGRIRALARAHGLLTGSSFQGAEITDLVREQLLLGSEEDSRISQSGPALVLEAQPALHLALVLHELGTNARKHGALSVAGGLVSVNWHLVANNGRNLQLQWREVGGPRVNAPTAQGFGSVLIENSLRAYGGEVPVTYAESGVVCEINLPLPELSHPIGALARETASFSTSATPRAGIDGKRILIVEDEPLIGMVLTDYLQDAGCEIVGPIQNADRAEQMAGSEAIDAALVDGNLAGRRVDEIVSALRGRRIPFAFVTGYGREALPPGFDDAPIIEKPFTEDQVISTLNRLLNNVVQLHAARHEA
ncbi:MAG: PAS domain S-box protein [Alphaproteobacteria bacterium]|nr:PAS domain S-box protein [Alphaproteobacteria bacterium]